MASDFGRHIVSLDYPSLINILLPKYTDTTSLPYWILTLKDVKIKLKNINLLCTQ